jgi:hypothetical protein
METPIENLIQEKDSSAEFEQQRQIQDSAYQPGSGPLPSGPSKLSALREFMNQKYDYISVLLVFFIILLVANNVFTWPLKSVGLLFADNRLTMLGTVVVSIIGALIYFVVKILAKI